MSVVAWLVRKMTCIVCSHEWVATFPKDAPALECSGCGYMNDVSQ